MRSGLLHNVLPQDVEEAVLHPMNVRPLRMLYEQLPQVSDDAWDILLEAQGSYAVPQIDYYAVFAPGTLTSGTSLQHPWREVDLCESVNFIRDLIRDPAALRALLQTAEQELENDAILPENLRNSRAREALNEQFAVLLKGLREVVPREVSGPSSRVEELDEDVFGAAPKTRWLLGRTPTWKGWLAGILLTYTIIAFKVWLAAPSMGTLAAVAASSGVASGMSKAVAQDMVYTSDLDIQLRLVVEQELGQYGGARRLVPDEWYDEFLGPESPSLAKLRYESTNALRRAIEQEDSPEVKAMVDNIADVVTATDFTEQRKRLGFDTLEPSGTEGPAKRRERARERRITKEEASKRVSTPARREKVTAIMREMAIFWSSVKRGSWQREYEGNTGFESEFIAYLYNDQFHTSKRGTGGVAPPMNTDEAERVGEFVRELFEDPDRLTDSIYSFIRVTFRENDRKLTATELADKLQMWTDNSPPKLADELMNLVFVVQNEPEDMISQNRFLEKLAWGVSYTIVTVTAATSMLQYLSSASGLNAVLNLSAFWLTSLVLQIVLFLFGGSAAGRLLANLFPQLFAQASVPAIEQGARVSRRSKSKRRLTKQQGRRSRSQRDVEEEEEQEAQLEWEQMVQSFASSPGSSRRRGTRDQPSSRTTKSSKRTTTSPKSRRRSGVVKEEGPSLY